MPEEARAVREVREVARAVPAAARAVFEVARIVPGAGEESEAAADEVCLLAEE